MYSVTVERWQEIERDVLSTLSARELEGYLRSMVNWAKRRKETSTWVLGANEKVEVGDVVFADFGVSYNMEIGVQHLALVVAVVKGKAFVVPMTSNRKHVDNDEQLEFNSDILLKDSAVFCNDARFINTARVIKKIGKVKESEWRTVKNYVLKGILNNGWQTD